MDMKQRTIGVQEVLDLAALLSRSGVDSGLGFRKRRLE